MNKNNNQKQLVSGLERCKESIVSLESILSYPTDCNEYLRLKKRFIIESLIVKSTHESLQKCERIKNRQHITSIVRPYNEMLVHVVRLDSDLKSYKKQLQSLKKTMFLPKISLTTSTVNNVLRLKLPSVSTDSLHDQFAITQLLDIYSLSHSSLLPRPVLSDFKTLLNLEAKKRLLLQIKYELLLQVRSCMVKTKRDWGLREACLLKFIEGDLVKVLNSITQVRREESINDEDYATECMQEA